MYEWFAELIALMDTDLKLWKRSVSEVNRTFFW